MTYYIAIIRSDKPTKWMQGYNRCAQIANELIAKDKEIINEQAGLVRLLLARIQELEALKEG